MSSFRIPLAVPHMNDKDLILATEQITKNNIALGPYTGLLEDKICQFIGAKYAVATNSGTSALHLLILAAGCTTGDLIISPAFTFAGTVNAILSAGCVPFFFDVKQEDLCIDVNQVERFLYHDCQTNTSGTFLKSTGQRVSAIMAVHMYGNPCDIDRLQSICQQHKLKLIEDGAEALGAKYGLDILGKRSNYFALSFNGNKVITSAGGGMAITNDEKTYHQIKSMSSQGKDLDKQDEIITSGFNYKMPNINATLAFGQAERLPEYLKKKADIFHTYQAQLEQLRGFSMVKAGPYGESSYWMPILRIDRKVFDITASDLQRELSILGIETRNVWKPLDEMLHFSKFPKLDLSVTRQVYTTDLCLPCSVGAKICDIEEVSKHIIEIVS